MVSLFSFRNSFSLLGRAQLTSFSRNIGTMPSKEEGFCWKNKIKREDILSLHQYEEGRTKIIEERRALKNLRRVLLGPDASLMFENYDNIWTQIHEMLRIEKGGEEQIPDEIEAYSPLIPDGKSFVATLMFEIDQKERRDRILRQLGYVEEKFFMDVCGTSIPGTPLIDTADDRTTPDGKTSSIHFLKFSLPSELVKEVLNKEKESLKMMVGCSHPNYSHLAGFSPDLISSLLTDLDPSLK